jgi:DNA polymerase-3 subunit epsilon
VSIEDDIANGWRPRAFAAIDFETANRSPTSACAVAIVRVEQSRVVDRRAVVIRPPTTHFEFTDIHGMRWADVKGAPGFGHAWKSVASLLEGVQFIAAHNAKFDEGVLRACCADHRVRIPTQPFVCTVKLARLRWNLHPAKLPNVCEFLGLGLNHHDPLSDAEACAGIVLAAMGDQCRSSLRRPSS